jgi:hypothetical protein
MVASTFRSSSARDIGHPSPELGAARLSPQQRWLPDLVAASPRCDGGEPTSRPVSDRWRTVTKARKGPAANGRIRRKSCLLLRLVGTERRRSRRHVAGPPECDAEKGQPFGRVWPADAAGTASSCSRSSASRSSPSYCCWLSWALQLSSRRRAHATTPLRQQRRSGSRRVVPPHGVTASTAAPTGAAGRGRSGRRHRQSASRAREVTSPGAATCDSGER